MFNWHELDRDDIIRWMITHILSGHHKDVFNDVSRDSDGFSRIELKMVINGHEFDGERALRDLFTALDSAFDRAVAKKVQELTQFTNVEDMLTDILQDARRRVDAKMDQLGYPALDNDY